MISVNAIYVVIFLVYRDTNTTTTTNNNNDNQLKMTTASEVKDKINNIYLFIEELSIKMNIKDVCAGHYGINSLNMNYET